jgi:hypothetical protein
VIRWTIAALCAVAVTGAAAQSYPTRAVRVVVPFAPGGNVDINARNIGPGLAELLGQQVIVDNRPGAGGTIATDFVAKGTADGGAGSARRGAWMRPGSGPLRAGTNRGPMRAYTVASPKKGPLLRAPARLPTATRCSWRRAAS